MRFLADENIPLGLIDHLREMSHDVMWIRTTAPGLPGREIVAWATTPSRIGTTFDKDFGELTSREPPVPSFGIILLRVPMPLPGDPQRVAGVITPRTDWAGHLSTIEPGRTRMRPLIRQP